MLAIARYSVSFLMLVAITNAQDSCVINGLTESKVVDGIRVATGLISVGSLSSDALLLQPISKTELTPPILFSHSDITIDGVRTDLRPMALRLAKRGASVLVLERVIFWEPGENAANRDAALPDCASQWLLRQQSMDVMHAVYIGPKVNDQDGRRRKPLAFTQLKQPRRGALWVPLAETESGYETVGLTEAETQDPLLESIATHMVIDMARK